MKRDHPLKHAAIAFAIAIACYVLFYWGIEHQRRKKGPWQVAFTCEGTNAPTITINQHSTGITNVQIAFLEQAPQSYATLVFAEPRQVPYDLPFGQCVFMDTTFLPGTLTFRMFSHEIELLPRVLVIDHKEHRWASHERIVVARSTNAPALPGSTSTRQR